MAGGYGRRRCSPQPGRRRRRCGRARACECPRPSWPWTSADPVLADHDNAPARQHPAQIGGVAVAGHRQDRRDLASWSSTQAAKISPACRISPTRAFVSSSSSRRGSCLPVRVGVTVRVGDDADRSAARATCSPIRAGAHPSCRHARKRPLALLRQRPEDPAEQPRRERGDRRPEEGGDRPRRRPWRPARTSAR